jgi:hypothetical protein
MRKLLWAGLLTLGWASSAVVLAAPVVDQSTNLRCDWGKQVTTAARQGELQGLSRHQVLARLNILEYNPDWRSQMAYAITAWVFEQERTAQEYDITQDYVSRCQTYYLTRQDGPDAH